LKWLEIEKGITVTKSDPSLIISVLALVASVISAYFAWRKVSLEGIRQQEAKDKKQGRSIHLNIVHVERMNNITEFIDDTYFLEQVANSTEKSAFFIHISFVNTSDCEIYLSYLNVVMTLLAKKGWHPSAVERLFGRLMPTRYSTGIGFPFRFRKGIDPYTYKVGGREFQLPLVFRLLDKNFFTSSVIWDEDAEQLVSQKNWVELKPGERKRWLIGLWNSDMAISWITQRVFEFSEIQVELEFDTCTVKAQAPIPKTSLSRSLVIEEG
jgi:hypothetical protein